MLVISIGYFVRFLTPIPNSWIPLIGVTSGTAFFSVVAPMTFKTDQEYAWNWYVMMIGAGFIISAFAWLVHRYFIRWVEDQVCKRFPLVDNIFNKTSDDPK